MIGKKINQLATELAPVSTDLTIIGDPISGVSKKITLAQLGAIFSGAVSFYTNLAGFPATGDINVIYCAKDTQKLYLWSGSAYVEVFPSQALLDTYQLRSEKGVSNGYASLDSSGKVPISQLPSSIMEYKGTWNASTNTPTLANGTGDTGDVYICNVAGTVNFGAGAITFAVGDYVIYSGTIWQRSSGAVGTVTSVAASITGNAIGITGSPVTTSGTLAFAFAGTGAQYIKGDGTLATFPNTISQAEKLITEVYNSTGATLTKGTIVYINGGQGNLPTVTKALATGDSTSAQTFGVVQADITNNNNGYVVVAGKLSDLDTQAYTPGTQLYLSSTTAGTWTSTKQYAPAHLVYVGIVVRAHPTQGIVEIKIQNGYELDELHDVAAQTPTNNDGLFWESATSLWKNKSIATVLGYTPQPQLSGTGFVKISGTTISYDNSTYLTTSAAASTYLPLVLNGSANTVDINGQQFTIQGSAGGFTSGRIIVDPVFSAIGYQNAGVFDGLKILTNGNAEFTNSGVTRFFNQVRFDSTLTNGTYTYTLPGASGTIALVGGAGVGTVTSVGLSSATSGVTIGSTPITTSGTITLAIATASGSQQGLLSSTDWTTFNNKQNALTNPVTGTGTTNYLPKFTGTSTIGNSQIFDNGTNVGIGTATPSYKLDVSGAIQTSVASGNGSLYINNSSLSGKFWTLIPETASGETNLLWYYGGAGASVKMNLTNSGNLGLGVTPSAWGSNVTALELPQSVSLYSWNASAVPQLYLGANHYWDGSTWRYKITGQASTLYYQAVGQHQWYSAPSGTAGNAISFTQAMTLNASGNLSIGNTNDSFKLDVTGTGRFTSSVTTTQLISLSASGSAALFLKDGSANNKWEIGHITNSLYFYNYTRGGNDLILNGSTGAATFSDEVRAGSWIATANNRGFTIRNAANTAYRTAVQMNSSNVLIFGQDSDISALTLGVGSEAMRINSSGNVGIATTSPNARLDIGSGDIYVRTGVVASNVIDSYNTTLTLRSNGSNAMFIDSSQRVGIGTTSPTGKLHSYIGDITAGNNPATSGTTPVNAMLNLTNNRGVGMYFGGSYSGSYAQWIQVSDVGNLSVNYPLALNPNGGNVGIGTTSPSTKLHVSGTAANTVAYVSDTTGYALYQLGNSGGGLYYGIDSSTASGFANGAYSRHIYSTGAYPLIISTNETERIRITSGGLVGIGTSSPSQRLEINGNSYTNGTAIANQFLTTSGTVSNPFNVWTTMFTIPTGTVARYELVVASQGNGGSYTSQATIVVNNDYVAVRNYTDGGVLAIQTSGYDVQCKNGSGSTLSIRYKFIRID